MGACGMQKLQGLCAARDRATMVAQDLQCKVNTFSIVRDKQTQLYRYNVQLKCSLRTTGGGTLGIECNVKEPGVSIFLSTVMYKFAKITCYNIIVSSPVLDLSAFYYIYLLSGPSY